MYTVLYMYDCVVYHLQVNTQMEGKGPLHLAIIEGFISVLKTILKFRPDLDMEVSE